MPLSAGKKVVIDMTTSAPTTRYAHDVFVSYSHKDRQWVEEVLLPILNKNDLLVLTDHQFPLGKMSIKNMEDAVHESRRTVVVLTQDWIESKWSQYEAILTGYLDVTGSEGRLIPILLKPCDNLPRQIEMRTRLELIDRTRIDTEMQRLVSTLQKRDDSSSPPSRGTTKPVDVVGPSLTTVADALRAEPVRGALRHYRSRFEEVCDRIQRLATFKDVHDQLHHLQLQCFNQINREAKLLSDGDPAAVENLIIHVQNLRLIIDELRRLTSEPCFERMDMDWVDELEAAYSRLKAAVASSDADGVRRGAKVIDRVLAVQPTFINTRLNDVARELGLEHVIAAICAICDDEQPSRFDGATVRMLIDARNALHQLHQNLTVLVGDHDRWQHADTQLRRVEKTIASDPDEIRDSWPALKAKIDNLAGEAEWAVTLRSEGETIDSAMSAGDLKEVEKHFRIYRHHAVDRFFRVDSMLKRHSDELRKIGEPLAAIVRVLS